MTTYKKLSLVLGIYAAMSFLLTITPLVLPGSDITFWKAALLVVLPLLVLFLLWRFIDRTEHRHSLDDQTESERNQTVGAVYVAGPALLIPEALAVLRMYDLVDAEPSHRLLGVSAGVFVMVLGNAMPKVVFSSRTLVLQKLSSRAAQAANRFSGLALMVAGAGMVLVWTLLPFEPASAIAPVLLLAAVISSCVRYRLARR